VDDQVFSLTWTSLLVMALSSSPCGFCGGFGGSFNRLRWNKALLRVVVALEVHEE